MQFDDLPRLADEERDALDGGYVAMEGVPASWACLHCKGSGTDPSEGHLCEACEGSGNSTAPYPISAAEPPKRLRRFQSLWSLLAACRLHARCAP